VDGPALSNQFKCLSPLDASILRPDHVEKGSARRAYLRCCSKGRLEYAGTGIRLERMFDSTRDRASTWYMASRPQHQALDRNPTAHEAGFHRSLVVLVSIASLRIDIFDVAVNLRSELPFRIVVISVDSLNRGMRALFHLLFQPGLPIPGLGPHP
jgi:hypothetical protein